MQNIEANQYDYLTYGHIIDNLNSNDINKTLSANQGRVLSEKIDNIDLSYLEDEIASLGTSIDELDINKANNDDVNTLTEKVDNLHINSGYGRIRFKWDDSTGYLRAAVDNTENVVNLKGHVTVPFSFGVDANGNYGYIKDGADTVIPFNQVKELTFNVCQSNAYATGTIHIYDSKEITKPGAVSCGWTVQAVTNYIRFTTTAKELYLYGILTYQTSTSYSHNFSITGCDYEILEDSGNKVSGGVYAKIHLYNIPANTTISLNCYTSYSAVSGIGYLIYEDRY